MFGYEIDLPYSLNLFSTGQLCSDAENFHHYRIADYCFLFEITENQVVEN